jgi:uncharacterized protein
MKLADTNLWLALALSKHKFHSDAHAWLATMTRPQEVVFCRSTQQSFLRLLTTEAMFKAYGLRPFSNQEAWALYKSFLANQHIGYAQEPDGLEAQWETLASRQTASPKIWMDAYLAAFAISGDYQLVTIDNDFKQYVGLNFFMLQDLSK